MGRKSKSDRYLRVGDRFVERGDIARAATAYLRCADACQREALIAAAAKRLEAEPARALKMLAEAWRALGPSPEIWLLTAKAYEKLGEAEIAKRFRNMARERAADSPEAGAPAPAADQVGG